MLIFFNSITTRNDYKDGVIVYVLFTPSKCILIIEPQNINQTNHLHSEFDSEQPIHCPSKE